MSDDLRLARVEKKLDDGFAIVLARLDTIGKRQVQQRWEIASLQAQRWVATSIRSRAPAWLTAAALVGILVTLLAR